MNSALEEAQDTERRVRPIRFLVGAFITASILMTVTLPDVTTIPLRIARWGALAFASVLTIGYVLRSPLSLQGAAWIVSALYAAGTVIYTIDVPATVLRSISFIALTIGAFAGTSICYREQAPAPHRLPGRIGFALALMGVPSIIALVLGGPEIFFHYNGMFRGVFVHPNTLGAFVSMWLVVGIGAYESRLSRHRNTVMVGMITLILCVVSSRSRAGLASSLIAIATYVLVTRQMRRLLVGGLLAGTVLLTAFVMLPYLSETATREGSNFIFKENDEDLFFSRRDTWEKGWDNFLASPGFGHGFGTSVGEEMKEWKLLGLGGREKGNAFLAALEETGVVGTLVLCFPLCLCIASGFRVKRLNVMLTGIPGELKDDARLTAAFWAGAMGGVANNLAESTLWSPGSMLGGMLLFLAGASEGLLERTERRL